MQGCNPSTARPQGPKSAPRLEAKRGVFVSIEGPRVVSSETARPLCRKAQNPRFTGRRPLNPPFLHRPQAAESFTTPVTRLEFGNFSQYRFTRHRLQGGRIPPHPPFLCPVRDPIIWRFPFLPLLFVPV